MGCLSNMNRITLQLEQLKSITKLYQFKGKDFYYQDILKRDLGAVVKENIEHECYAMAKLLKSSLTENRLRLIIKKDSLPRTNEENIICNIKNILSRFNDRISGFDLETNQFLFLGQRLFYNIKKIEYAKYDAIETMNMLSFKKKESKRDILDNYIKEYKRHIQNGIYESISLAVAFYIDYLMSSIFNEENELIGLFILYALIYREGFDMFKYVSFFDLYIKHEEEFKIAVLTAKQNWAEGFSNITPLTNLIMNMLIEGYMLIDGKIRALEITSGNNKTNLVENTIFKSLPQTFTKQMIVDRHPNISLETIDRTLKRLRMENKIRPNGTGRSATWNRLVEVENLILL